MAERPVPFLHVASFRKRLLRREKKKKQSKTESEVFESKPNCLERDEHKCQKDIFMIKAKSINEINCNTELSQLQKQSSKDNDRLSYNYHSTAHTQKKI